MGLPFVLGQNEGPVHTTFGVGFKTLPPYPRLKKLVLDAHGGLLNPAASSRRPE